MNISDLKKESEELKLGLQYYEKPINMLSESYNMFENIKKELVNKICEKKLDSNNSNIYTQFCGEMKTIRDSFFKSFSANIKKIDTAKILINIMSIKRDYKFFRYQDLKNSIIEFSDARQNYIENEDVVDNRADLILKVIDSVEKVMISYNYVTNNIRLVNEIYDTLIGDIGENTLEIRFMNENKSVAGLRRNIELIEEIYNNVNLLLGNKDELLYVNAESGSFKIIIAGCISALLTMEPLLSLSYKIYSEQLSPKAKIETQIKEQELELDKIKVKSEYIKLIAKLAKDKNLATFNLDNNNEMLKTVDNLDRNIKELYSINPYIRLNDNELGTIAYNEQKIPLNFLETADETDEDMKKTLMELESADNEESTKETNDIENSNSEEVVDKEN